MQLNENKIKAKHSKCDFTHSCIIYLGHMEASGELRVEPDKVSFVADWAAPLDSKGVTQFLGFASCYNRFIHGFAHLAAPISKILSKKSDFVREKE